MTSRRTRPQWLYALSQRIGFRRRQALGAGLLEPISRSWGADRGKPLDRIYIERFLERNSADIKGTVLELLDSNYTRLYGNGKVTHSEVLHATPGNPHATFVGNLETGENIPSGRYDCIILTETLYLIRDVRRAIQNAYDALKPGGVLLVTSPVLAALDGEWGLESQDYGRFTPAGARWLFGEVFGEENVTVGQHGNVLVASAFLYGLAAEDLRPKDFEFDDDQYPVSVNVRAVKPAG